jgi:kynurenine 3-monooxygenase
MLKFCEFPIYFQDKTWTVTLFMPFVNFNEIKSPAELLEFFKKYFPDSIKLIGEERLIKDFFKIKPQSLVMVKVCTVYHAIICKRKEFLINGFCQLQCQPYHVTSKVLLMGDAAHAMVPFYGQGMNAGFEDCTVLSELFNKHGSDVHKILAEFSETRWENAHAICDLAMYNYIEMRDLVTKRSYLMRKFVDEFLYRLLPNTWMPLYNSVSFSHMPYKKCIDNRKWQDKVSSLQNHRLSTQENLSIFLTFIMF